MRTDKQVCLVFAGGLGLGAYHGGAFEAFAGLSGPADWITGSSAGAITAALIAGSPSEKRVASLRAYWHAQSTEIFDAGNPNRHLFAWLNSISTHLFGAAGFFYPRLPTGCAPFKGLYDLGPTRERLRRLIDFGRLNAGEPRVTIAATDLASGEPVLFDSRSEPIGLDHILASCGFIPDFAPVNIGDRWLGDGGFSLNAPFDPVLEADGPLRMFVIDLYARDGKVPDGLESAAERKGDLLFGNQTLQRLRYALAARRLRAEMHARPDEDEVYVLSYRPGSEEAGPEKSFDLSQAAMAQRWRAGLLDMQRAGQAYMMWDGIRLVRRGASSAMGSQC